MNISLILLLTMFCPISVAYAFEPSNMTDFNPVIENGTSSNNGIDQEVFLGNKSMSLTSDSPSEMSLSNMSDFTSGAEPPDLSYCDTNDYPSTACKIVKDLISLSPKDIEAYGLGDQNDNVIQQIFIFLNPGNITKVLQNMPPEELSVIRDKLTPKMFNETISRIPVSERDLILNKLTLN